MTVTTIKKLDDGYIVYTKEALNNIEKKLIRQELVKISLEPLGLLFFRTVH
jgi:hypothetical protein